MVGTTTKQFDYESGWLPNKEWTSTIKGHFSKEKAIQIAKERAMKENKELEEGRLDHIKDKWQSELDKGVEPKILMDPWAVCEGMKWLGKDGWIRVEEVLIPTEYEEPYPDFYMEIFDQHTCKISHDIYTINEINSYVKETKARLVNNGIKKLTNEDVAKMKESRVANANENILELMDYFISDLQDRGYRKVTLVRGAGKTAGPSPKTFFAVDSTDTVKRIEVSVDGQYEDDIIAMFDRYSGGVVGSSIYQLCTADPESPDPKNPELIWWAGKTKEDFINDLADMWKVVRSQSPRIQESKKINERVLDYDTYDEFYKQGCEAYFEGKSLDEVPITGNAWFREAWQEGWKDSKAVDDEDVRRAEAEYEDELEWEDYYSSLSESESKLTESRVKLTKNHNNIVEALRAAIASFQSIGVQVQLLEEMFGQKTLDVSYGPYHVFFDTLDDEDGLYDGYGKYLLTLPLANESDVQWIGGNENELFADLKDVFNVLDKIMAEPNENGRNFAD